MPKLGMSGKSNLSSSVSRYIPVERRSASDRSDYCLEHTEPDLSDIVSGLILRGPLDIFLAFLTTFFSSFGFSASFLFWPNICKSAALANYVSKYDMVLEGEPEKTYSYLEQSMNKLIAEKRERANKESCASGML